MNPASSPYPRAAKLSPKEEARAFANRVMVLLDDLTDAQAVTLAETHVLDLLNIVVMALRSGQLAGKITPMKFLELLQRASSGT